MFSYDADFCSRRADGRHAGSLSALLAKLRSMKPELQYNEQIWQGPDGFAVWKKAVRAKLVELLKMPNAGEQPAPRMLSTGRRDGYALEKWEFYPDEYSVVPFLLLRPDGLSSPAPGVLCIPGSASPKELLAGEPMPANPNCRNYKFPDRNAQALHCVKEGYIAVAFDNPGTAELAEQGDSGKETNWGIRVKLVQGYIDSGTTYAGVSVWQKLRFLSWFKSLPEIDGKRIAVMGHSLGTEAALALAVLSEDICAVVFNDFVCDERARYCAITEYDTPGDGGNWHEIPGIWQFFAFQDLLAALAPRFLALNEGGAQEWLDKIWHSYESAGFPERLQISSYPRFAGKNPICAPVPLAGLSEKALYEDWCQVDAPDHSFRMEPSMRLLAKAFGMQ